MTKIIGLTGGIGSGKSTVARIFMDLGVPVYFADDAGRDVMDDITLIENVRKTFGDEVILDGIINRKVLADIVFNNSEHLQKLNSIVHPAVAIHFKYWFAKHQDSQFIIKEVAILFESGSYKNCDLIISVVAPEDIRIERVINRDKISTDAVRARMNNQWTDEQRIEKSDFIINNTTFAELQKQTLDIYSKIRAI